MGRDMTYDCWSCDLLGAGTFSVNIMVRSSDPPQLLSGGNRRLLLYIFMTVKVFICDKRRLLSFILREFRGKDALLCNCLHLYSTKLCTNFVTAELATQGKKKINPLIGKPSGLMPLDQNLSLS